MDKRKLIAEVIAEAIKKKGWKKQQLAKRVGVNNSVITKWLSGVHNFTLETLMEIEHVLEVRLINVGPQPPQTTKLFMVVRDGDHKTYQTAA
jgi:ribosome-binding protein aMBF1 (putative translation factor)